MLESLIMPYTWSNSDPKQNDMELQLWPHQSLSPKGFSIFILTTSGLILLPVFPLLGSTAFWGLLPFLILAVAGVWYALDRSYRNAQVLEVLTLSGDHAHLVRHNPKGDAQAWS